MTELKKELWGLFRELEAILVLTNSVHPALRKQLDEQKEEIGHLANKAAVRHRIEGLRKDVVKLRHNFGVKASASTLLVMLERAEAHPKESHLMVPKHLILEMFPGYDYNHPHFKALPNHATIWIGLWGEVKWSLLEARLYEDTCALFNLAMERHQNLGRQKDSKAVAKSADALAHATVLFTLNFVEAFLNGLYSRA